MRLLFISSLSFFLLISHVAAQTEVSSAPMGGLTFELQPGIDNFVTVPLRADADFLGEVLSSVDLGSDQFRINAVGTDPFLGQDFTSSAYYVRFLSGAEEGKYFDILSNDDGSVTFDTLGDSLILSPGDTFHIVKHWTLAELFPPGTQTALTLSTGNLFFQRGSVVLIPGFDGAGINRSASGLYYITATEWRDADTFANSDDVIIRPNSYFQVRQKSSYSVSTFTLSGTAPLETLSNYLFQETSANDNLLSHGRPVPIQLQDLDLGSEFVDSTGNLFFQRRDVLLVYSNTSSLNPSASKIFYRVGGQWRDAADFSVADTFEIDPNEPIIIRKIAGVSAETLLWTNSITN